MVLGISKIVSYFNIITLIDHLDSETKWSDLRWAPKIQLIRVSK